jgi:dipeptidyl aminopeptidase/acylaminoacyl peptidase
VGDIIAMRANRILRRASHSEAATTRARLRWVVAALALLSSGFATAEPVVSAREGNVYISTDGVEKQLTTSGRDSSPLLAPDGKWIAFVRAIDGKPIPSGSDDDGQPAELWQIRVDGKEPTRLVRTRPAEKPENIIAGFENLQFSADGRLVYFVTPAWTTSGAVHVVDTTNGKERYLLPGNDLEVIHSGEYRDHLLVSQHRYFIGGGSYDWFYLFTPQGKEVGPVGEDTENFKSVYLSDASPPNR